MKYYVLTMVYEEAGRKFKFIGKDDRTNFPIVLTAGTDKNKVKAFMIGSFIDAAEEDEACPEGVQFRFIETMETTGTAKVYHLIDIKSKEIICKVYYSSNTE